MSSWIGHVLGALTLTHRTVRSRRRRVAAVSALAIAPDVDMLFLQAGELRWTHSVLFVVAVGTLFWLGWMACFRDERRDAGAILATFVVAGASHVLFDMLVGVSDFGLFVPLSDVRIGLPFGILPSAPGVSLTNVYLYRNLGIEALVYTPLFLIVWRRPRPPITAVACSTAALGMLISALLIR